jgi:hypothetical protein
MKRTIVCLLLAVLAAVSFAQAAKAGSIGVFGGLGSSSTYLGASYQMNDSLTLRAGLGLDLTTTTYPSSKKTVLSPFGITVDGLFLLPVSSGLSFGAGPRVSYHVESTKNEYTTFTQTDTDGYFGIGGVGNIQYLFAKNFGAFIDGSLMLTFANYSSVSTAPGSSTSSYSSTRFSTNTSLGLVFFIK